MNIKQAIRILRQVARDREPCLIPHLASIDPDFFTRDLSGRGGRYRNPHPLFDARFYRAAYLPASYKGNPFCHYLRIGFKAGHKPSPYFDADVYANRSGWRRAQGNPLRHYLRVGAAAAARPGIFFDIDWYLDRTPGLHRVKTTALTHYLIHGAREGKSPVPVFDPAFYLAGLADTSAAVEDPLAHYLTFGLEGDERPGPWFDPVFYRRRYLQPDDGPSPLEHYLREGVFTGNYPDERIERLPRKPLISLIVPVYNPEPVFLDNCIRSVLYQSYPHWELCLADDGSTRPGLRGQLLAWQRRDKRIKVAFLETNRGISTATNAAAALARGTYCGFLDNDDELTPDCLYHVVEAICRTDGELFYSDEDLIGADGRHFSTFHKPDFNRELLFSHNYITHFVVAARSLFDQVEGLNPRFDGAQDFDLMLRLTEKTERIVHIPRILYHWRAARTSTSIDHGQKGYANEAGRQALGEALIRRNRKADVSETELNFYYRISPVAASAAARVSVVLWLVELDAAARANLMRLVTKTDYLNCEFVLLVGEGEGVTSAGPAAPGAASPTGGFIVREVGPGEAKTGVLDEVVRSIAAGAFIAILEPPLLDLDADWLTELVAAAHDESTGIVCGRTSVAGGDGRSYTVPDLSDGSADYFAAFLHSCTRHMNGLHCLQRVSLCDWEICLFRRDLYLATGGFDQENFPDRFAMLDFSLRVSESGRAVVYTPYARRDAPLPAKSDPPAESGRQGREKRAFQEKWHHRLNRIDPFYNGGVLDDNAIDRERFFAWLSGAGKAKNALT